MLLHDLCRRVAAGTATPTEQSAFDAATATAGHIIWAAAHDIHPAGHLDRHLYDRDALSDTEIREELATVTWLDRYEASL
jgi:hypothetical protein